MLFNYYPADIHQSEPLGDITLARLLYAIKHPRKNIMNIYDKIKAADEAGDLELKNKLKTHLYACTPCVYVKESRKYANIVNWTGLLVLDFDKLDMNYAKEFKLALFDGYKFIIASWLSCSRHGVRALVKIPVCLSVEEFKQYFDAIKYDLSVYRGFDRACQNCILPLFLSYDPDLLERKDYTEWTQKYIAPVQPPIKQYIVNNKAGAVEKIINIKIQKIYDNGHPQLRAAAYLLGGYIGGGAIGESQAITLIENMIDANAYLSKKSKVYKKTANTMIKKGQLKPVYLR